MEDVMSQLVLSQKNARHVEVFKQYSKLTGIPLEEILHECFSEYREYSIEVELKHLAEQAACA
jgi:hypothetical protein